jgi:hypothetical protein
MDNMHIRSMVISYAHFLILKEGEWVVHQKEQLHLTLSCGVTVIKFQSCVVHWKIIIAQWQLLPTNYLEVHYKLFLKYHKFTKKLQNFISSSHFVSAASIIILKSVKKCENVCMTKVTAPNPFLGCLTYFFNVDFYVVGCSKIFVWLILLLHFLGY